MFTGSQLTNDTGFIPGRTVPDSWRPRALGGSGTHADVWNNFNGLTLNQDFLINMGVPFATPGGLPWLYPAGNVNPYFDFNNPTYPRRHPSTVFPGILPLSTGINALWIRFLSAPQLGASGSPDSQPAYLNRLWLSPLTELLTASQILSDSPTPPLFTPFFNNVNRSIAIQFPLKYEREDNNQETQTEYFTPYTTYRNMRRTLELKMEVDYQGQALLENTFVEQIGTGIPFVWIPEIGGYWGGSEPNCANADPSWECIEVFFDKKPQVTKDFIPMSGDEEAGKHDYQTTWNLAEVGPPIIDILLPS